MCLTNVNEYTHNKGTGPVVWPSLPSRLAQWTARSLSSLPVMQRYCLLLHRAAMLSEWKPGVSREKLGPKSATIYPLRRWVSPPFSAAVVRRCIYSRTGAVFSLLRFGEGLKMSISCDWNASLSMLPPSSRCVGLPLQTALGPLLASASWDPVGLQGR